MVFQFPRQIYNGRIATSILGSGAQTISVGGATAYPFHLFEGQMPNRPRIAMEVWDYDPGPDWPPAARAPFQDVMASPAAWARKCVREFGAELIVLQLKSTDPNGRDAPAAQAAQTVLEVMAACEVPLILWGTANNQKDEEVLKRIAEKTQDQNLCLAPVEEANHKGLGAAALAYGHTVAASSPIDVNLAKQLNILLGNLGVAKEKALIDPTTGGLGYGLEYSFSVMERIRMAALTQEDEKLQMAMINNIGNEVWKSKEAGTSFEEAPQLGDPEKRAVLMETVSAVCYLLAGSDIVILRHPESACLVRLFIDLLMNGGSAKGKPGIHKRLEGKEADLAVLSAAGGRKKDAGTVLKTRAETEKAAKDPAEREKRDQPKTGCASPIETTGSAEKERSPQQADFLPAQAQTTPPRKPERSFRAPALLHHKKEPVPKTPALEQLDLVEKLSRNLDRIHGR
ncbi:MAG: acetyl-CoA decarbonylase/synthase complex subunit delta [Desulfobacteraceae bacterium]|nr:MAG: acetyl-CoA decarbonylase/synthase complex subunit delta [Desulfobacteraceae bacterium]